VDGSPSFYPMSEKPLGIPPVKQPDRKPFASGDWFKATDDDYKQEASTYIAYTGEFRVDEEKQTRTHSMFISLFPNWMGQTQPPVVKIEGDTLHLSSSSPLQSGARTVKSFLVWKRAKANLTEQSNRPATGKQAKHI